MMTRVLVVEDEAILAIDIATHLTDAGFSVVGPATSVTKALTLIGEVGCDVAVLDVNLRDETAAYQRGVTAAREAASSKKTLVEDWYAFTLSFKGVVLEGLEVAFIALTFGANQHDIPLAALAAVAAVLTVCAAGVAIKAPLARVPENTMKFAVGVMLTGFGVFWGAEGAGADWPGGDAALPLVLAYVLLVALSAVWVLKRRRAAWAR